MNPIASLVAITRRALSINYRSPSVCVFSAISSGSGTGSGFSGYLDILPVARKAGPISLLTQKLSGTSVKLTWTLQPYIYSHVVFRATSPAGPFTQVTANVIGNSYTDAAIPAGTYYWKVTGIEPDFGETLPSPTAGPVTLP